MKELPLFLIMIAVTQENYYSNNKKLKKKLTEYFLINEK